jgi:hypothetical protein
VQRYSVSCLSFDASYIHSCFMPVLAASCQQCQHCEQHHLLGGMLCSTCAKLCCCCCCCISCWVRLQWQSSPPRVLPVLCAYQQAQAQPLLAAIMTAAADRRERIVVKLLPIHNMSSVLLHSCAAVLLCILGTVQALRSMGWS